MLLETALDQDQLMVESARRSPGFSIEKPLYTQPGQQIRSFVRRAGRLTVAQRRALEQLWSQYGIDELASSLNLIEVFGRSAPCFLEIGFGDGESLAELAACHPENNYLGVEVHRPGIGHLLWLLERRGLDNVRIIEADAWDVLQFRIPDNAVDGILVFFPDPWPKRRHHKRRLIQPGFLELVAQRLKLGGVLHLATDWTNYAEHMHKLLQAHPRFNNCESPGKFSQRPATRPQTKFERRGLRLQHPVYDLLYERI